MLHSVLKKQTAPIHSRYRAEVSSTFQSYRTMRRQNYEFQVSRPQVITKMIDGKLHEPMEFLIIEVPDTYVGPVMEKLGSRKGELINMGTREGGVTHIEFRIPSRGLMGYRPEFLTDTNGNGIMNHVFDGYEPYKGEIVTVIRVHSSLLKQAKL